MAKRKPTIARLERERAAFQRVLAVVPRDKWAYRDRLVKAIAARDAAIAKRRKGRSAGD